MIVYIVPKRTPKVRRRFPRDPRNSALVYFVLSRDTSEHPHPGLSPHRYNQNLTLESVSNKKNAHFRCSFARSNRASGVTSAVYKHLQHRTDAAAEHLEILLQPQAQFGVFLKVQQSIPAFRDTGRTTSPIAPTRVRVRRPPHMSETSIIISHTLVRLYRLLAPPAVQICDCFRINYLKPC